MPTESQLREKLRKIEALFAGAGTAGERLAAEAALEGCGANFRNRRSEALGNIMRLMRRELHSRFLARFCH